LKLLVQLLGICIAISFVYAGLNNDRPSKLIREGVILTTLAFGGTVALSAFFQLLSLLG